MFIQRFEAFFEGLAAMSSGLPLFVLVPLIMILSAVGTAVISGLLLGLVRLVFGKKAIDFIKNIPNNLNKAAKDLQGGI